MGLGIHTQYKVRATCTTYLSTFDSSVKIIKALSWCAFSLSRVENGGNRLLRNVGWLPIYQSTRHYVTVDILQSSRKNLKSYILWEYYQSFVMRFFSLFPSLPLLDPNTSLNTQFSNTLDHCSFRWPGRPSLTLVWNSYPGTMRDFRFPPRCQWDLRFSGMLRSVVGWVVTDVAGQPIVPIFTVEDGTYALSRNVSNYPLRCVTSQQSEDQAQVWFPH